MECKYLLCNRPGHGAYLLIEPEWNVNTAKAITIGKMIEAFNRTRMECKFYWIYLVELCLYPFNRTRMECK